jgi:tetratricopeptide (TPR) repeat protein
MNRLIRVAAFTLAAAALPGQQKTPPAEPPQYFDPPTFIAAGVTDGANRGGHGSDVVLRSSEALARAAANLSSGPPAPATGQWLRESVAKDPDNAELHHSLGDVEEKAGNPLEALRQYQRAVELKASEPHLFDLGAELLKHRAAEQAAEVFTRGARLFPRSTRMLLGSAVACYSRGEYEQARERFFEAADVDPVDPTPYLFLGKAQADEIVQSLGFALRMERFATLHPESAWAGYYYALSLWKRAGDADAAAQRARARPLLERAVQLDPRMGAAWLQLGILYAEVNDYAKAVSSWQNAVSSDPTMEEAHYRLGQAYRRMGEQAKAKAEIEHYEQLSRESAERVELERAAIKEFVFALQK